jgi:hypothetical protein
VKARTSCHGKCGIDGEERSSAPRVAEDHRKAFSFDKIADEVNRLFAGQFALNNSFRLM